MSAGIKSTRERQLEAVVAALLQALPTCQQYLGPERSACGLLATWRSPGVAPKHYRESGWYCEKHCPEDGPYEGLPWLHAGAVARDVLLEASPGHDAAGRPVPSNATAPVEVMRLRASGSVDQWLVDAAVAQRVQQAGDLMRLREQLLEWLRTTPDFGGRWVACSEALPPVNRWVLVVWRGQPEQGVARMPELMRWRGDEDNAQTPSWWRPLPLAPEEP